MPPKLIVLEGGCAGRKAQRTRVTTDAPNIFRIAPTFPPKVLAFIAQIPTFGGSFVSARWVNASIEVRYFVDATATDCEPFETIFLSNEQYKRMFTLVPLVNSYEDGDYEIPVELDAIALAALAEEEALRSAGVTVLDDRR